MEYKPNHETVIPVAGTPEVSEAIAKDTIRNLPGCAASFVAGDSGYFATLFYAKFRTESTVDDDEVKIIT